MKKLNKFIAITLCALLLFAASACGKQEAPIDSLIIGTTAEILSANRSEYNYDVLSGTLCQLAPIYIDENGRYAPQLCNWATDDSKTYTLTVRDGMRWHDGESVTAEDIAFTLNYLDTQNEGGYASRYESIEVVDEKTIKLTLPSADPRALGELSTLRIMPKHIYENVADYTTVPNELANIGCGPYKFDGFDSAAGVIKFSAFADYPEGAPSCQNIAVKLYSNEDTMYMALKAHEIDMVYKYSGGVSPSVIAELKESDGVTLTPVSNTANSAVLIFNNSVKPYDNVLVRRAIAYAIDYEGMRNAFGSEYAVSSRAGFIPNGTIGYTDTPVLSRDLTKASALLAEAGAVDSDGDGMLELDGEKLILPIMLRSDKSVHARYAEMLKNNLAEVGIDVTLDVREVASFRELTEQKRAHTAVITGLTAFGMAKNQGMASLYIWGENSMGYAQVSDPEYKALLDAAAACADMDDYIAKCADIQNYYAENLPAIALFWDSHVQAYSSRLSGFVVDGTFGLLNVQSLMQLKAAN